LISIPSQSSAREQPAGSAASPASYTYSYSSESESEELQPPKQVICVTSRPTKPESSVRKEA
jgi:hypothetical protein